MPSKKKAALTETQKLRKEQIETSIAELQRIKARELKAIEDVKNDALRCVKNQYFTMLSSMTEEERKMPYHVWYEEVCKQRAEAAIGAGDPILPSTSEAAATQSGTSMAGERTKGKTIIVKRKATAPTAAASSSVKEDNLKTPALAKTTSERINALLSDGSGDEAAAGGAAFLDVLRRLPRGRAGDTSISPMMARDRHGQLLLLCSPAEILTTIAANRVHGLTARDTARDTARATSRDTARDTSRDTARRGTARDTGNRGKRT